MLLRHVRAGFLLTAATLVLAAIPAVAGSEPATVPGSGGLVEIEPAGRAGVGESAQPTPSITELVQSVRPAQEQQQSMLRLSSSGALADPGSTTGGFERPVRPGEDFTVGFGISNGSTCCSYDFVLTVTLPPEVTLIRLQSGDIGSADCNGNVCRATIAQQSGGEADNFRSINFRGRLSESFRGTSTLVRGDLQEDASPNPADRTATTVVSVEQPAAGTTSPTTSPASGTRSDQASAQTLPVTGNRTTVTGLVGLLMLVLGTAAHSAGGRRRSISQGV